MGHTVSKVWSIISGPTRRLCASAPSSGGLKSLPHRWNATRNHKFSGVWTFIRCEASYTRIILRWVLWCSPLLWACVATGTSYIALQYLISNIVTSRLPGDSVWLLRRWMLDKEWCMINDKSVLSQWIPYAEISFMYLSHLDRSTCDVSSETTQYLARGHWVLRPRASRLDGMLDSSNLCL